MFQLTPAAAQVVLAAVERSDAADLALRVAARREDDGRLTCAMGFDEPREDDQVLQIDGLTVLIGPRSRAMLDDMVLDYEELEQGGAGFIFAPAAPNAAAVGPQARQGCGDRGCGACDGH